MTYRTTLGILSASIVLALAGTVQAQAPAAPSTIPPTPAPAANAPAAAPATTPAPAAAPKSGTSTSKSPGAPKRTTTGKAAPTGTPGVAAVPGASPSGSAKPRKEAAKSEGQETRQLQTAYADLMTPEEMAAHKKKVKQTKTYAECKTLFDATGKDMEARAKAQNKTVKATPTELCDKAKERGRVTG